MNIIVTCLEVATLTTVACAASEPQAGLTLPGFALIRPTFDRPWLCLMTDAKSLCLRADQ